MGALLERKSKKGKCCSHEEELEVEAVEMLYRKKELHFLYCVNSFVKINPGGLPGGE